MANLPTEFHAACEQVRAGTFAVSDDEKLMLYALFKIARGEGTPPAPRPSVCTPVARAKWDAWTEFSQAYSGSQALELYVQLVGKLASRRTVAK
jgi:acyl-CoA-binding protein